MILFDNALLVAEILSWVLIAILTTAIVSVIVYSVGCFIGWVKERKAARKERDRAKAKKEMLEIFKEFMEENRK